MSDSEIKLIRSAQNDFHPVTINCESEDQLARLLITGSENGPTVEVEVTSSL